MQMETLSTAMNRLHDAGYTAEIVAAPDGALLCNACADPCASEVVIDDIVRFEGSSDPGDAAILVAVQCGCGHAGLFSSAYGVDAAPEDARALGRLASTGRSLDPTTTPRSMAWH